jgi:hypothetical protein
MKAKLLAALLVVMVTLVGMGSMARASGEGVVPVEDSTNEIGPNSYWETWVIWSTQFMGETSGPWMMGPKGVGPGTVHYRMFIQSQTPSLEYYG